MRIEHRGAAGRSRWRGWCARVACTSALWLACGAPLAQAQWTGSGVNVTPYAGDQDSPRLATDGHGGLYVGWNHAGESWVQRLDAQGFVHAAWPATGKLVAVQPMAGVFADGAGGAHVVGTSVQTPVYHVDANDGSIAHLSAFAGSWLAWTNDARGGLLGRAVTVSGHTTVHALARLDSLGEAAWSASVAYNLLDLRRSSFDAFRSDGAGGAWAVMRNDTLPQSAPNTTLTHLDLWHFDSTGVPPASWGGGVPIVISTAVAPSVLDIAPPVALGSTGTALMVWTVTNGSGQEQVLATRVLADGMRDVSHSAVPVTPFDTAKRLLGIADRGAAGAFTLWDDSDGLRLIAINAVGANVLDQLEGASVMPTSGAVLLPDGTGGAYLAWVEQPEAWHYAIRVVHERADLTGDPAWGGDAGIVACTTTSVPTGLAGVLTEDGLALAWADARNGADSDVRVARIGTDGVVPTRLSFMSAEVHGDAATLSWYGATATDAATVQRSADGLEWTTRGETWPDLSGRCSWTDAGLAPGTRWGYRLADAAGTPLTDVAWVRVPDAARTGIARLGGHPATGSCRFALTLDPQSPATFEILDATGRVVHRAPIAPGAEARTMAWSPGAAMRAGVYFARLTQSGRAYATRFVVLR